MSNTLEKLPSPAGIQFYLVQHQTGEAAGTITRHGSGKWRGFRGLGKSAKQVGEFSDRDDAIRIILGE